MNGLRQRGVVPMEQLRAGDTVRVWIVGSDPYFLTGVLANPDSEGSALVLRNDDRPHFPTLVRDWNGRRPPTVLDVQLMFTLDSLLARVADHTAARSRAGWKHTDPEVVATREALLTYLHTIGAKV